MEKRFISSESASSANKEEWSGLKFMKLSSEQLNFSKKEMEKLVRDTNNLPESTFQIKLYAIAEIINGDPLQCYEFRRKSN